MASQYTFRRFDPKALVARTKDAYMCGIYGGEHWAFLCESLSHTYTLEQADVLLHSKAVRMSYNSNNSPAEAALALTEYISRPNNTKALNFLFAEAGLTPEGHEQPATPIEHKPCPFDNSMKLVVRCPKVLKRAIKCTMCGALGPLADSETEAWTKWDKRQA
jgi:hypothetical protein